MAFTGTAVIKEVSDGLVRITGVSLAAGAAGTIALFESIAAPGVRLPEEFKPRPYQYPDFTMVTLQDSVQIWLDFETPGSVAVPISVVKTGTDETDFLATLTSHSGSVSSGGLEIYVRYH